MLRLSKQQIDALANKIYSDLNSEEVKSKRFKKWLESDESKEYRTNIRPLFKKAKKILETNDFLQSVKFKYLNYTKEVDNETEEIDIAKNRSYSTQQDWQFKEFYISTNDIREKIVLNTIELSSLDEVINKIKKIYEY